MMWPVAAQSRGQRRHDPAPTRIAYRYQRLMLRPLVRRFLTRWLPFVALLGLGTVVALLPSNRQALQSQWHFLLTELKNRPEFAISAVAIEGASDPLQGQLRRILPQDFPQSRFDLDLAALREAAVSLPAVADASMAILGGGILEMRVDERQALAVWRAPDGLFLVDAEGVAIRSLRTRAQRADLPLVAGVGAAEAIGELAPLQAALGPLAPRARGFVRRGERRWDLLLDRDQRILLPEIDPARTLKRVVALSQATGFLERDLLSVDMRVPQRSTLRLGPAAIQALTEARNPLTEEQ